MSQVYQIKILLLGSKPPIWRRITIDKDSTLEDLHQVIQVVMGWYNSHLHEFLDKAGKRYKMIDEFVAYEEDEEGPSEADVELGELLKKKGDKLLYVYDFGDYWEHEITLEKIVDSKDTKPCCLKGKNACPPEDCGGIYGFYEMLEILANPEHPEYETMADWLEDGFDPAKFDIDAVNAVLR